jgi:hypothetical protein
MLYPVRHPHAGAVLSLTEAQWRARMPLYILEGLLRDVLETGVCHAPVPSAAARVSLILQGTTSLLVLHPPPLPLAVALLPCAAGVAFDVGLAVKELHDKGMSWVRRAKVALSGGSGVTMQLFLYVPAPGPLL